MSMLKKILFSLIAVLVFLVVGGGAYLTATGKISHITGQHGTTNQTTANETNDANKNSEQTAKSNEQNVQDNQNQMNMSENNGGQGGNEGSGVQQGQTRQEQTQQGTGQQPVTAPTTPAQGAAPTPQVKVINPEPYYKKLNEAQETIDEANKMLTIDPFKTDSKNGSMGVPDMSKLHEGIAKMSEGVSILKETLDELNREIRGEVQFGVDPYQQAAKGYSYASPYPQTGVPNGGYPQGYSYPQGFNYPQGYNYSTGNGVNQYPSNAQQNNQGQPNNTDQQSNHNSQVQQNNQTQQDQSNHTQSAQQDSQANSHSSMPGMTGTTATNTDFSSLIRTVIYGVLAVSIIAVFASIFGIIKGFFQQPEDSKSSGGAN